MKTNTLHQLDSFLEGDLNTQLGGATPNDDLEILWAGVNSHSIVALTDERGIILFANDKFCELSGFSRTELLGKPQSIVNSGYHKPQFWEDFWKCIESGNNFRGDICNRRKDKSRYWVDTTVVPLMDHEGHIRRYISIRTDITAQKELEFQLQNTRDELASSLSLKTTELTMTYQQLVHSGKLAAIGQISSSLAHEIKNPLFVALGNLQNLSDLIVRHPKELDPKEVRQKLNKAISHLDRISELMSVLNNFLRAGSAPNQTVLLSSVINRARILLREPLVKLGITLNPEYVADPIISANQSLLEQVIVNIILNAKDAFEMAQTPVRSPQISVTINTDGHHALLAIKDNGPGIPPDIIEKIFEPFFTTKPTGKGTGLGLSLSKQIVESAGGSLQCHSKVNEGTEFVIRMPLSKEQNKRSDHVRS